MRRHCARGRSLLDGEQEEEETEKGYLIAEPLEEEYLIAEPLEARATARQARSGAPRLAARRHVTARASRRSRRRSTSYASASPQPMEAEQEEMPEVQESQEFLESTLEHRSCPTAARMPEVQESLESTAERRSCPTAARHTRIRMPIMPTRPMVLWTRPPGTCCCH